MLLLILYGFRLVGQEAASAVHLKPHLGSITVNLKPALKLLGTYLFFFLFAQIIVTMLLGIYFLTDRLQFLDDPND